MAKGDSMRFVRGAWAVYTAYEQIQGYRRAYEQDVRILESLEEARRVREFIMREEASTKLGAGRLGTADDAARLGMTDPSGLFLGAIEGRPMLYNGVAHLLTYAPTQTGKGRDLVLPNLAHVSNRSLVCTDVKNGENAYASAHHRRVNLRHRTIALNPYGLLGAPTFRLNPFSRLVAKARRGESIVIECLQAGMSICPPQEKDSWVHEGAQELLATWIEHRAKFRPEECTLSNLWRFVNGRTGEMLKDISRCGDEALEHLADDALRIMTDAEEQWSAYHAAMKTGMRSFRPGEPLAAVTETSTFDPADLRQERGTVYLMSPENQIEGSAKWIALTITSILETCASTPGPVPICFLIDELANLPYMPIIPKALTLYAGLGIQLWGLCQGRDSLYARGYSQATVKTFEQQAAIFNMWGVTDPALMRDIEACSGKKAVAIKGVNNAGGQVSSASFGISEHARPVLQSEDISAVGEGRQIIRGGGGHLFVADRVPYFMMPQWRDALRDVRTLHYAASAPERPIPPPARMITHHREEKRHA